MTDFIKEESKKIILLADGNDYFLSAWGSPVATFTEIEVTDGNVFLGREIRNYNPIQFCDCLEFMSQYLFQKRRDIQSISINKIVDEGIKNELARRGIVENQDYRYVIPKKISEFVKERQI